MTAGLRWRGVGLTDRGLVRATNQDAYAVENTLGLWVVADGMGGHAGGDVASRLAVETVVRHVSERTRPSRSQRAGGDDDELLRGAIAAAQGAILDQARRQRALAGMGTTCVVLRIADGAGLRATLAHVGDSRAYRWRGDRLTPLTRDHGLVEDYVSRGLLTPAQALTHPMRHVLTRALGIEDAWEPDLGAHELHVGDLLLLCTDGLTKMVADERIGEILRRQGSSPERSCEALVQEALRRGGEDNVTVLVCTAQA